MSNQTTALTTLAADLTYTIEQFGFVLEQNESWAAWGLKALFTRQLLDEQADNDSKYVNDLGFNKPDGSRLGEIANILVGGGHLTEEQWALVQARIRKYSRQLLELSGLRKPELTKGQRVVVHFAGIKFPATVLRKGKINSRVVLDGSDPAGVVIPNGDLELVRDEINPEVLPLLKLQAPAEVA